MQPGLFAAKHVAISEFVIGDLAALKAKTMHAPRLINKKTDLMLSTFD